MSAIVPAIIDQVCASLNLYCTISATKGAVLDSSSTCFIEWVNLRFTWGRQKFMTFIAKYMRSHYKPTGEDGGHTVMLS